MGRPQVISLGGGAFVEDENCELATNNGVTVWLDCPFSMVERRVAGETHRPLARDPEQLKGVVRSAARQLFTRRISSRTAG